MENEKSKKATPVGADLKKAAMDYAFEMYDPDEDIYDLRMECFIAGAKWMLEHPTGGELLHVCNKTAAITKREMIDKACEWLSKSTILADTTIERFRKAMEE